jgi:hypothetical protein
VELHLVLVQEAAKHTLAVVKDLGCAVSFVSVFHSGLFYHHNHPSPQLPSSTMNVNHHVILNNPPYGNPFYTLLLLLLLQLVVILGIQFSKFWLAGAPFCTGLPPPKPPQLHSTKQRPFFSIPTGVCLFVFGVCVFPNPQ